MSDTESRDDRIVRSWTDNAAAWTRVVREGLVPSRAAGTDAAILEACAAYGPGTLLDVGCGEGWLTRAVTTQGMRATGIDVSAPLIDAARARGGGEFEVVTYEQLERDATVVPGPWSLVVCNFSLLADPVHPLLAALRARLESHGALVIQTVHPWAARGDAPYTSGWRTEAFDAFAVPFPTPMPWYYRTLASWHEQVTRAGLRITRISEPLHPATGAPLSLLLHCEAA